MNSYSHLKIGEQRGTDMRRCFFVCVAYLAVALLGACTGTRLPQTGTPSMLPGEEVLARHFSLVGRISVRVNDQVDSGQIRWHRSADQERIGLYAPLGLQVAELVSDRHARMVTVRRGGETLTAASVAELTQSLLGVALDLDRAAEWVQGFGLRENESTDTTLANGDVWRVSAAHYRSSGNYRFASRVTATRGDTVVRLIIDEWTPL